MKSESQELILLKKEFDSDFGSLSHLYLATTD